MSSRRKRILFGAALLLVILAYWIDRQHPFPAVLRNQQAATTAT
jgi:hypothetical protein